MTALFLSKLISKKLNLIPNYFCTCSLMLRAFDIFLGRVGWLLSAFV